MGTRNPLEVRMSDATAVPAGEAGTINPPAISLREAWPWTVFAGALLLMTYFVGFSEGASAMAPGGSLHEWLHDGRHLLGFPCH
jgi:hypothetical protein